MFIWRSIKNIFKIPRISRKIKKTIQIFIKKNPVPNQTIRRCEEIYEILNTPYINNILWKFSWVYTEIFPFSVFLFFYKPF